MYKIILALFITGILTGCNNAAKKDTPGKDTGIQKEIPAAPIDDDTIGPRPGRDRDEHGCIGSAGYNWSVLKNDCIRIFEAGVKMEPKDPSLDERYAAFVVFSDDMLRAELFIPTKKSSVILRRAEKPETTMKWSSGHLTLTLVGNKYTLDDEGKLLYQQPGRR